MAITGDILQMPGLPKVPSTMKIDLLENGDIEVVLEETGYKNTPAPRC